VGKRFIRVIDDLLEESIEVVTVIGLLESNEFVEDNADCPNICFVVILLTITHLWRHEIWSTFLSGCKVFSI
jgi:hypothetical protein